jgi:hypothetical protein
VRAVPNHSLQATDVSYVRAGDPAPGIGPEDFDPAEFGGTTAVTSVQCSGNPDILLQDGSQCELSTALTTGLTFPVPANGSIGYDDPKSIEIKEGRLSCGGLCGLLGLPATGNPLAVCPPPAEKVNRGFSCVIALSSVDIATSTPGSHFGATPLAFGDYETGKLASNKLPQDLRISFKAPKVKASSTLVKVTLTVENRGYASADLSGVTFAVFPNGGASGAAIGAMALVSAVPANIAAGGKASVKFEWTPAGIAAGDQIEFKATIVGAAPHVVASQQTCVPNVPPLPAAPGCDAATGKKQLAGQDTGLPGIDNNPVNNTQETLVVVSA